jgi:hypothetical protein
MAAFAQRVDEFMYLLLEMRDGVEAFIDYEKA